MGSELRDFVEKIVTGEEVFKFRFFTVGSQNFGSFMIKECAYKLRFKLRYFLYATKLVIFVFIIF